MIFKNNRGEVPGYVIGLIIAIIILLVAVGVVLKIKSAQKNGTDQVATACTIAGNTCEPGTACTTGTKALIGICPENQVCCTTSSQG